MKLPLILTALVLNTLAWAGQPTARFRAADHFTLSQGSVDTRYGNADSNVKITLQVFLLGQQVFNNPSNAPETRFNKTSGSLDFTLKLSDFDVNLPPDTITMSGVDLGSDLLQHTTDSVLPGPYHIAGTYAGSQVDLTLTDVHVTGTLQSQGSNAVVPPIVNPVLNEICDVQFDDPIGFNNSLTAVPAHVSGWVVSPIFTVSSMRVDVTGIQQAGQVPATVLAPVSFVRNLGRVDSGDVSSLAAVDGNSLRVCKFLVPNLVVEPVNMEILGTLASTPQYLSLLSLSHMTSGGSFVQKLDLYDFSTSTYSTGDARIDVIDQTLTYRKLDATGPVSRYMGPSNQLRARYRIQQTGPSALNLWCTEHDFLGWLTTP